ncbi:hypothetical protein [Curtobacterium sp. VKM Ac-2887]|uniref:hypothetical protein n=1 Tax=Curtobacterium sp. VKM Ac-2887 TaxID=2783819 RepID=UPI00188D6782|nr:hypothetical protein [Curtobacterium sp. VKM Ac-2887]MBF4588310.1 hypothetical protein [Curtobacterium sp. VKM Ac-2887]
MINGLLLVAALLLLIARRSQQRLPVAIAVAGIASAAGLVFDGFVHESPASSLPFHFTAALFIIFGGIVAFALAAVYAARTGMHPVFVWVPALFAGIQLISTVLLNMVPASVVGIAERGSFYPVLIAELAAGVLLLAAPSVFGARPRPIGVSTEAQVAR